MATELAEAIDEYGGAYHLLKQIDEMRSKLNNPNERDKAHYEKLRQQCERLKRKIKALLNDMTVQAEGLYA
jgi:hypothetical protein